MSRMWLGLQEKGCGCHLAGIGDGRGGGRWLMPSQRRDMADTRWIWGQGWCHPGVETWMVPKQM